MHETEQYDCPYCGERVQAQLDLSGGDQTYIENCPACRRPICFTLQIHDDEWMLDVRTDTE